MLTLTILTTISTCLSICGCFVIFFAHKFWRDVRSSSRNILLYITIADLFTALGYLFDLQTGWEHSCMIQSFVTTSSSMVSFFWTSCMALYLHAVSVKANFELGKRIIFVFHCLAWPVPFMITLTALLNDKLGKGCAGTANWCWIKEGNCNGNETTTAPRYETVFWMLFTGKFWEITSYILIVIIYSRIGIYVHHQRKLVENQSNATAVARFRAVEIRTILIPKFFILIRIWGTLQFLVYAFSGIESVEIIKYFQACGDGLQGFVNAILFCLIADKLKLFLLKCCTRSRKKGERASLLEEHRIIQHKLQEKASNPV